MTATSDQLIRAAMTGKLTEGEFDDAIDIALRVEQQILCPVTNVILGTVDARAWTLTYGDQETTLVTAPDVTEDDLLNRIKLDGVTVERSWQLSDDARKAVR